VSPTPSLEPSDPHLPLLDDPLVVLDPATDPGGASLGTTGSEASVDLPWPVMLRRRVEQRAQRSSRYEWWVLVALLAGLFSLNFTFTVFVVALPAIKSEFHTNYSVLTWVSTGPLLAFGLAAPLFGKAGDLFGYRRLYLWGLGGAMVAAIMTATAPNVWVLVFARCLDGVQGAATGTASMALILRMFAPEDRVKAMGWWSMVGAGGPVIGVTLGAPIIQYFGWRTLFVVQLGLLVISLCVVALVLPSHGRHSVEEHAQATSGRWQGMDWVGSWSLSAMVTGAMLSVSIGPVLGWDSLAVVIPAVVAVVATGVFIYRERTAAAPLIPPGYFKRRNFMFPMGTRAATMFAYFGAFFLFPLLMEEVYGYSVTEVGLISIARPLLFAISAPIAGYLAVRIGERISATFGAICILASMIIFASLGTSPSMIVIVLALCLAGLGMGVASPSTSSSQANEVKPTEFGVMSATQQLATQVGEVAGIQILISVQESSVKRSGLSDVHHGLALLPTFQVAFWVGAVVAVTGVVCAAFIKDLPRPASKRAVAAT